MELGLGVSVDIGVAGREDLPHLANLLREHASPAEQDRQGVEEFTVDLEAWWTEHDDTHLAFVARLPASGPERPLVGMAWLAFVPRVPRPGNITRRSADIQSVYVLPDKRGRGVGSALVKAAADHAFGRGAVRVTVKSGRKALPLYERLGFASSPQLLQLPTE
jgi:GNAT superfamily N-acetyltransferase